MELTTISGLAQTNGYKFALQTHTTMSSRNQGINDSAAEEGFDSGPSFEGLLRAKERAAAHPAGSQPCTPVKEADDKVDDCDDSQMDGDSASATCKKGSKALIASTSASHDAESSTSAESSSDSDSDDSSDAEADDADADAGAGAGKRTSTAGASAAGRPSGATGMGPKAGTPSSASAVGESAAASTRKRGGKHQAPSDGVRGPEPGAVAFPALASDPADDDGSARTRAFHELALATAAAGTGGELATRSRAGGVGGPAAGPNAARPSGTLRPPSDRPIAFSMVTMQPTVMLEFVRIMEPALKVIDPNNYKLEIWVTKSPDFEGMVVDMMLGGETLIVNARLAVAVDIFPPPAMSRDDGKPPATPAEILLVVDPTLLLQTLGTIKPYAELCMYMEWTRDKLCFMTRDGTERTRYTSVPLRQPEEAVYHSVLNLPVFDFDANIPASELKGDVAQAVHARAKTINLHLRGRTAKSWLFCVSAESDRQCLHNVLPIWVTDDALCSGGAGALPDGSGGGQGVAGSESAEVSARIRGEYKTDRVRASNDPMPSCESEVLALPALFGISIKCRLLQAILKNIPEDRYLLLSLIQNEPLVLRTVVNSNQIDSYVTFVVTPDSAEQDAA